jgi:hypothetical protein
MKCSDCNKTPEHGSVFVTHSLKWGKRVIEWTVCSRCERESRSEHPPDNGVKVGV